ncbi:hypothetical protein Q5425_21460 [Amycolatopsis sp. A133]|uniref:hypothetical protein n=1 Tax=Amycolatopsis sp. A133 TaxID=3064472 RepID=UPI0027EF4C2F|nr:hypothetical protein [Amycolatopsis sp. A133]MDQ7806318.1 hypothetical protein [Amycolatopsis sp. A133]
MMWLFGQIWLWLIVAFALGALTSWLVLRARPRPSPEPSPEPSAEAEPLYEPVPPPLSVEQTQFIPAAWAQHGPDPRASVHDDEAPEPVGHREGHLPLPPQRGAQAEDWPTEDEPAWPESEEAPQWPHQPGRGS